MRYKFNTKVLRVERKNRIIRAVKIGDEIVTTPQDMGWYVHLEGSWESLYLGFEQPDLVAGDVVTVILEKVDEAC